MELVNGNASAIRSLIMTRYNELVKDGMETKAAWAASTEEVASSLKPPVTAKELNVFLVGPARAMLSTKRPKKYKKRTPRTTARPTMTGAMSEETPILSSDSVSTEADPFIESMDDIFVEQLERHLVSLLPGRVRRISFFDATSASFAANPKILDRVAKRLSWEGYLTKQKGSILFIKRTT